MTEFDPDRPDRLAELFEQARELPEEQRSAFLDRECGDDDRLRSEIESLLAHHGRQGDFLARPTGVPSTASLGLTEIPELDMEPGTVFDRYNLVRKIGDGGFGVVYLAKQTRPVRRDVALKVIKPGMDTAQVLIRFEAERQALALMSHPNVATVLDAGATDAGRPYFVMEYVPGDPITDYCDRHRLGTSERLELFTQACEAVQHAHQKGIIHRDIKPSNILVSVRERKPLVKVIDFGVAKATQQRLTERTMFTEHGQLIGTPAYMSPEQAEMGALDIDTRSDIYSLGVLLYELLVGVLPFDPKSLREAGYARIQRIIREVEPPKPSTRLSSLGQSTTTVARNRSSDPRSLQRDLRGDLDWVVMRCLEKDRTRRYETAAGLIEELQRHLRHEPVLAGPPSASYRFRKFVRRHRSAVAVVSGVMLLLVSSTIAIGAAFLDAKHQRGVAEARAAELEKTTAFQSSMFTRFAADRLGEVFRNELMSEVAAAHRRRSPGEASGADAVRQFADLSRGVNLTTVSSNVLDRTLLTAANDAIDEGFRDEPNVRWQLLRTLGEVYAHIGLYEKAEKLFRHSLDARSKVDASPNRDLIQLASLLGMALIELQRTSEALDVLEGAEAEATDQLGPDDDLTLEISSHIGLAHIYAGDYAAAEPVVRATLDAQRRVHGDESSAVPDTQNNLGVLLWNLEQFDEAVSVFRETLAAYERLRGPRDRLTLRAKINLATALADRARRDGPQRSPDLEEAGRLCRETLEIQREVLGEYHGDTLHSMIELAEILTDTGDPESAERMLREAANVCRDYYGFTDPRLATLALALANPHLAAGRHVQAIRILGEYIGVENVDALDQVDLPDPQRFMLLQGLAVRLANQGRWDDAEAVVRELLVLSDRLFGPNSPTSLGALRLAAAQLASATRYAQAEPFLREALRRLEAMPSVRARDVVMVKHDVGFMLLAQERPDEALPYLDAAYDFVTSGARVTAEGLAYAGNRARCLAELGRTDEALAQIESDLDRAVRDLGPKNEQLYFTQLTRIGILLEAERLDEAAAAVEAQRPAFETNLEPTHPHTHQLLLYHGMIMRRQGALDEAIKELRAVLVERRGNEADLDRDSMRTAGELADALIDNGSFEEAEPLALAIHEWCAANAEARSTTALQAVDRLIDLYESWHSALPAEGHDAQAAVWRESRDVAPTP